MVFFYPVTTGWISTSAYGVMIKIKMNKNQIFFENLVKSPLLADLYLFIVCIRRASATSVIPLSSVTAVLRVRSDILLRPSRYGQDIVEDIVEDDSGSNIFFNLDHFGDLPCEQYDVFGPFSVQLLTCNISVTSSRQLQHQH